MHLSSYASIINQGNMETAMG